LQKRADLSFPKYKNNIFLIAKCLSCPRKALILPAKGGAGALHFLVEHFSLFGFDGQYWMLIVVAITAIFVLIVLGTRNRI